MNTTVEFLYDQRLNETTVYVWQSMKLLGSQVLNREVLIEEQKEIRKKLIKKFEKGKK